MDDGPGPSPASSSGTSSDWLAAVEFVSTGEDRQVTASVGVFYAAYRLAYLGWNVLLTTRNAKGPDILIYCQRGCCRLTVQVKTSETPDTIRFGSTFPRNVAADFVLMVVSAKSDPAEPIVAETQKAVYAHGPFVYVARPVDIAVGPRKSNDAKPNYFVNLSLKKNGQFKDNWSALGNPRHS